MTKKQLRNVGLGLMTGPVLLLLVKSMAWMLDLELSEGWKDLLLAFGAVASLSGLLAALTTNPYE